jgi:hypothetical protein
MPLSPGTAPLLLLPLLDRVVTGCGLHDLRPCRAVRTATAVRRWHRCSQGSHRDCDRSGAA